MAWVESESVRWLVWWLNSSTTGELKISSWDHKLFHQRLTLGTRGRELGTGAALLETLPRRASSGSAGQAGRPRPRGPQGVRVWARSRRLPWPGPQNCNRGLEFRRRSCGAGWARKVICFKGREPASSPVLLNPPASLSAVREEGTAGRAPLFLFGSLAQSPRGFRSELGRTRRRLSVQRMLRAQPRWPDPRLSASSAWAPGLCPPREGSGLLPHLQHPGAAQWLPGGAGGLFPPSQFGEAGEGAWAGLRQAPTPPTAAPCGPADPAQTPSVPARLGCFVRVQASPGAHRPAGNKEPRPSRPGLASHPSPPRPAPPKYPLCLPGRRRCPHAARRPSWTPSLTVLSTGFSTRPLPCKRPHGVLLFIYFFFPKNRPCVDLWMHNYHSVHSLLAFHSLPAPLDCTTVALASQHFLR